MPAHQGTAALNANANIIPVYAVKLILRRRLPPPNRQLPQVVLVHHHVTSSGVCLLNTAVTTVSSQGTSIDTNVLFDEGSQRSFVSKGLADCLQVQPHQTENLYISTFGAHSSHTSQFEAAVIHLHRTSGQLIPLTVLIVPTLAAPICNINKNSISNLPYLTGLRLTHPVPSSEQFTICDRACKNRAYGLLKFDYFSNF